MRESIYEEACKKLQPEILKSKNKISYKQTEELINRSKEYYSEEYINIYEQIKEFTFGMDGKLESKTFEEVISFLKERKLDEFELDSFFDAIAEIYDVSYCEAKFYFEGKENWMSIGRMYPK